MRNNSSFLSNKSHISHYTSPQDEEFHMQESQNFDMLMNMSNNNLKPKIRSNKNRIIIKNNPSKFKSPA